jgi:hypothetical protein
MKQRRFDLPRRVALQRELDTLPLHLDVYGVVLGPATVVKFFLSIGAAVLPLIASKVFR